MSEKIKPDPQAAIPENEPNEQVPEWLASQLRRMNLKVMEEPVPDDLAALLKQLENKERGG